jgi:hypothetical protein
MEPRLVRLGCTMVLQPNMLLCGPCLACLGYAAIFQPVNKNQKHMVYANHPIIFKCSDIIMQIDCLKYSIIHETRRIDMVSTIRRSIIT